MKKCIARLKSVGPYSQSKYIDDSIGKNAIKDGETKEERELRVWRERAHYDKNGIMFIPPMQFTNCIKNAGARIGKIPGQGNSTYTKHFYAGVFVFDKLSLGVHKDEVEGETIFGSSDGKRGGAGKRVPKTFPIIHDWEGDVEFTILDPVINENAFLKAIDIAGKFIGIGRFRPANLGYYGRFEIIDHKWIEGNE